MSRLSFVRLSMFAVAPWLSIGAVALAETSPLVDAAKRGDSELVVQLIHRGASVDATMADGSTALLWASYHDDEETVQALLEAGADVNVANDLGATALWAASQNGSATLAALLLASGADPDRALLAGETPLMVAARSGATAVTEQLLLHGADPEAGGARGQTALMWAVAQHHPRVVEVLLTHGADVDTRSDVWTQVMAVPPHGQPEYNKDIPHGGNTALMFSARFGDLDSARQLIAAGADVNGTDAWGVSATTMAAHAGFVDVLELLLEAGADPNADGPGFAAIHPAVMRRDERMVAALLDAGADPNMALRTWTPTRRASRDLHFRPALVGATPLWLASRFSAPAVVRRLVDAGADVHFVHEPMYKERYTQVRSESVTVLMAAAGMGGGRLRAWVPHDDPADAEFLALETVQILVAGGADLDATDADGFTALDGAKMARSRLVADYLESRGGDPGK